ncbi:hypothetical protein B0H19DRAFT_953304 [Mycena capillaripes]|nr:hypothetical protein B0H19DRAFT_953304 [Mycena capillaripes]
MFPALRQLPRAFCRGFTSRAAIFNASPAANSVKARHPRPPGPLRPYTGLEIPDNSPPPPNSNETWNNDFGRLVAQETGPSLSPEEQWKENSRRTVPVLQNYPIPDAYHGRSIRVRDGKFAEAVRDLDKVLYHNGVRNILKSTDRHEKKGVKRRRIQSEQWRKHFAHQVRKNVQLVHKIRRRGA